MSRKKILLAVLLILVLLGSVAAGILWNSQNYVLVGTQFYPRGAQQLDLRGEDISVEHYRKILRKLPGCEILWDVPFQGGYLPNDTREITVQSLTEKDLKALDCFGALETLKAEGCTDYENLMKLRQNRPEITVEYEVSLGGQRFAGTAQNIGLDTVSSEDIANLAYLPELKRVLCGGGTAENIALLQEYCREEDLEFQILLGGKGMDPEAKEVTVQALTEEQLVLLQFLPGMEKLHIRQPEVSAQSLLALQEALPAVEVTWERDLWGSAVSSGAEELDLSGKTVSSLEELYQEMAYFPKVKTVFLGESDLDNEALAAYRDQVREDYKLVWTVSCGSKLKTRTDAKTFMPVRENVYYFNDEEAYNLRYCEEMVCIDIGHMSIHSIEFVEFMPDLEYLILAHTQVQYIEPIRHCKKLKFLELDWSPIKDLTPLKDCTALEDLNLGNTYADFAPVGEMTWLKNLWMVGCSTRSRYEMTQALPETTVMVTGSATVANGWRDLENYYAMRDLLGMAYMSW